MKINTGKPLLKHYLKGGYKYMIGLKSEFCNQIVAQKCLSIYVPTELKMANTSDLPDDLSVYTHYKPIFT